MNFRKAKNYLVQLFKLEMKKCEVSCKANYCTALLAKEMNNTGEQLIKPGRFYFAECLLDVKKSQQKKSWHCLFSNYISH